MRNLPVVAGTALAVTLATHAIAQGSPDHCYIHPEFVQAVVTDYYDGMELERLEDSLHAELDEGGLRNQLKGIANFLYASLPPTSDNAQHDATELSKAMLEGCLNSWTQRQDSDSRPSPHHSRQNMMSL